MSKKSMWSFKFTTASLVLIPVAVGINYIGKLIAGALKLPLWLDSIGTILASILAGPIIGAISGAINNIIYGLTLDPISFIYGLTSVAIGLVVGILAYKGFVTSWGRAVILGIIVALVAVVVSTPINIAFWGGQTGNVWGDALFAAVLNSTKMTWLASFLDELVVDLPDKIIVTLISYALYRAMPKSLLQLYSNKDDIEELK
ncbi:MAG: ECF transporter S component [Oscillospiraceae bacterium]|nr:ECF transporter S component [Oscillospiraceae bacterium]